MVNRRETSLPDTQPCGASPPGINPGRASGLVPQDPKARALLRQRAERLAIRLEQTQTRRQGEQYLAFRLGATERFGLVYRFLDEIIYPGQIAQVPCTPPFVAGVVNWRGQLLTVLDLNAFFRVPPAALDREARILVVSAAECRVGLLVNEVHGNEDLIPQRVTPPLRSDGVSNLEYVRGVYDGRVTLLDLDALLRDPNLLVNHSAASQ